MNRRRPLPWISTLGIRPGQVLVFRVCIIILTIFVILTYGCTLSDRRSSATIVPNFNEMVFLTTDPCSAPCWQGLQMGISTKSEVMKTLSGLKFIDQEAIRIIPQSVPDLNSENWVQGDNIVITCMNRQEPCLRLTIANDKLRDINIVLDPGLTLEEVMDYFGNPDYVGSRKKGGDIIDCRVEMIWLKQKTILYSVFFKDSEDVQNQCYSVDKSGTPSASLEIAEVRYLPLEDINRKIEDNQFANFVGVR